MENKYLSSAIRLYNCLFKNFWNGHAIIGPSAANMLELRIYRFIKSCFSFINWHDNYCFIQAQGSWIKSNWELFEITGEMKYRKVAIACSNHVIVRQRENGSWQYPLKPYKKYVATVEGTWGSLGLLETYKWTKEARYLEAALKWHDFLINNIGFQTYKDSLAINYFDTSSPIVPNNTSLVLRFLAELFNITNDRKFLKFNDKMVKFIQLSQNRDGELKYSMEREHYFCYHYNAFEFLDLSHYWRMRNNKRIKTVLEKLARYLSKGITEMGDVKYNCFQRYPEMIYVSGAAGAALLTASLIGLGNYKNHVERTYTYLLRRQRRDGSFSFSKKDFPYYRTPISYGVLSDNRLYPRALCHILQHLLIRARLEVNRNHSHG